MDTTHKEFFEELARNLDFWVERITQNATDPSADLKRTSYPSAFHILQQTLTTPEQRAALRTVIFDGMSGLLHSVLVGFDGGTQLAEKFTLMITTSEGVRLRPGLHEFFVEYLDITGRMPPPEE